MSRAALPLAALLLAAGCARLQKAGPFKPRPPAVLSGLDVLAAEGFGLLRGRKVGVITNRTGVDSKGRPLLDLLAGAPGVTLVSVLAPEHGFETLTEAGVHVGSGTLRLAGRDIPVHSLYGGGAAGMRPKPEHLAGVDALVFDIQDVGARFYTYLTTMGMALEEAKRAGLVFVVLDRPNPIGGDAVQGPVPDEPGLVHESSVAYFDVPTRHGLTAGEMAVLHNEFVQHTALAVVKMRGWKRAMWHDETGLPWIAPSPNMPDLDAAALYPGIANVEFANVSVGRGTPIPFRWVGAPWAEGEALARRLSAAGLPGVRFSAQDFTPAKSVHAGKPCRGVRMTITDRGALRPLAVFAHLAAALRDLHPKDFDLNWEASRKLIGLSAFKTLYDRGASGAELAAVMDPPTDDFQRRRAAFLLYPR